MNPEAGYGRQRGNGRNGQETAGRQRDRLQLGYGQDEQQYGNGRSAYGLQRGNSQRGRQYRNNRSAAYGPQRGNSQYGQQYGNNRSAAYGLQGYGPFKQGYGYGQQNSYNRSGRYDQQNRYNQQALGYRQGGNGGRPRGRSGGYDQQFGYNQQGLGYQQGGNGGGVRDRLMEQRGMGRFQGGSQPVSGVERSQGQYQQQQYQGRQRRGQQYNGNYQQERYPQQMQMGSRDQILGSRGRSGQMRDDQMNPSYNDPARIKRDFRPFNRLARRLGGLTRQDRSPNDGQSDNWRNLRGPRPLDDTMLPW